MIERLFESGAIQVLVTTEQLAWGMTMSAHLTIVMDTKKFDGRDNRWVDYPVSDIIQMMGRATRPHIDKSGVFCLLCHSSKKEYYKKFIYEPLPVESHLDQKEVSETISAGWLVGTFGDLSLSLSLCVCVCVCMGAAYGRFHQCGGGAQDD